MNFASRPSTKPDMSDDDCWNIIDRDNGNLTVAHDVEKAYLDVFIHASDRKVSPDARWKSETCETCEFCINDADRGLYQCRRFPPPEEGNRTVYGHFPSIYPLVHGTDYPSGPGEWQLACAEWKERGQ